MNQKNSRILFTTDLTETSRDVFEHAVALAVRTDAMITILHVLESGPTQAMNTLTDLIGREAYEKMKKDNEAFARNVLLGKQKELPLIRDALKRISPAAFSRLEEGENRDIVDSIEVRVGHIPEEVLRIVDERSIDVIVMGHRRRSMIMKAVLGSTVKTILKESKIPVYLVPIDA